MFYDIAHCPLNSTFVITQRPDGDIRIRLQDDTNCVHRAGCPSWGNIVRLFLIFLHLSRSFGRKSRRGRGQFSRRANGENRRETILINFCLSYISILMRYSCSRWINIVQNNIASHKLLLLTTVVTETTNNNVDNIFDAKFPFSFTSIQYFTNLDLFVAYLDGKLILIPLDRTQ